MSERNPQGRFLPGNTCGVATRYPPGRSGNPHGRPPPVRAWRARLRAGELSEPALRQIIRNPKAIPNQREAARDLLAVLLTDGSAPPCDAARARVYYLRFSGRSWNQVRDILLDETTTPERRAGAWERLKYCFRQWPPPKGWREQAADACESG